MRQSLIISRIWTKVFMVRHRPLFVVSWDNDPLVYIECHCAESQNTRESQLKKQMAKGKRVSKFESCHTRTNTRVNYIRGGIGLFPLLVWPRDLTKFLDSARETSTIISPL